MRLRGTDGLRMDVLSVSRVDEVPGTLLRVRMVNESGPDPSTAPFGNPGNGSDVCNIALVDPSSGDYWWKLDPCVATSAQEDLAPGEQATYDVLFPELPDDVGSVVVDGGGYFSSAEVSVDDEAPPTDLELPSDPADPEGGTLVIPEGTPDGGETTTRSGDEVQVELAADVVFDFDSANLTADATSRVEDLASRIADQAAAGTITITGYTDDVGDEAYNQTLSEQRAESVRAVLEPAVGRDDVSFEVAGRGEADPVAPNQINGADNPDGRARNRRVTIVYTAS